MNKLPCRAHPEDTCENGMPQEGIQDELGALPRTPHPFFGGSASKMQKN